MQKSNILLDEFQLLSVAQMLNSTVYETFALGLCTEMGRRAAIKIGTYQKFCMSFSAASRCIFVLDEI